MRRYDVLLRKITGDTEAAGDREASIKMITITKENKAGIHLFDI